MALLLQLLLPLPLHTRSAALAQLQSLLSSQLMSYLGSGLERVLESERACQVGRLYCGGGLGGRRRLGLCSPAMLRQRLCWLCCGCPPNANSVRPRRPLAALLPPAL